MSSGKPKSTTAPDKKAKMPTIAPPEVCVTDSSPKSPLIVVSNRLPFVLKRNADTNELERKAR